MDQGINVSARDFSELQRDIGEMKGVMAKMAEAIGMIVRLEERQREVGKATEQILDRVGDLERHQREADLAAAASRHLLGRIESTQSEVAKLGLEHEKDKARLQGLLFAVRALWIFAGSSVGVLVFKTLAGASLAATTGAP